MINYLYMYGFLLSMAWTIYLNHRAINGEHTFIEDIYNVFVDSPDKVCSVSEEGRRQEEQEKA